MRGSQRNVDCLQSSIATMDQRLGIRFDHYPTVGNEGRHRKQWHFVSLTHQGTLNKLARNYLAL